MAVTHQRRPDISIAMMQTILMETTVTCRGATVAWILSIGDMSRWSDLRGRRVRPQPYGDGIRRLVLQFAMPG